MTERYIQTHPSATEVSSPSPHSSTIPDNGTHSVALFLSSGLHLFGRSAYAERTAEAILSSRDSILMLSVGYSGCITVEKELQTGLVWVSNRSFYCGQDHRESLGISDQDRGLKAGMIGLYSKGRQRSRGLRVVVKYFEWDFVSHFVPQSA